MGAGPGTQCLQRLFHLGQAGGVDIHQGNIRALARQFAADWWPAGRLYSIDYANAEAADEFNRRTPLSVEIERVRPSRDNPDLVDAFRIRGVSDAEGRKIRSGALRLWLQTIDNAEGFWLDTGVLLNT